MSKIQINKHAENIEYTAARYIIYQLGLGARREGDYLLIFNRPKSNTLLYSEDLEEEKFETLNIDEGFHHNCLIPEGKLIPHSKPWMEIIRYNELLAIIHKKLCPNDLPAKPKTNLETPEMFVDDLRIQYLDLLQDCDQVEFII